jgi:addiction module RelB/DinJ family antitoxin
MGLSLSDAIRLLMLRVVDERRLPFEVKAPNATTRKAIAELEAGKSAAALPPTASLWMFIATNFLCP